MRRIGLALAAVSLVIVAWLVAAEVIFLSGMGHLALFRPPSLQWVQAMLWWRGHVLPPVTVAWLVAGGVLPTLVLLLVGVLVVQRWSSNPAQGDLYGTSAFGLDERDVRLKRTPFERSQR